MSHQGLEGLRDGLTLSCFGKGCPIIENSGHETVSLRRPSLQVARDSRGETISQGIHAGGRPAPTG